MFPLKKAIRSPHGPLTNPRRRALDLLGQRGLPHLKIRQPKMRVGEALAVAQDAVGWSRWPWEMRAANETSIPTDVNSIHVSVWVFVRWGRLHPNQNGMAFEGNWMDTVKLRLSQRQGSWYNKALPTQVMDPQGPPPNTPCPRYSCVDCAWADADDPNVGHLPKYNSLSWP